jgi:hypothetical protein
MVHKRVLVVCGAVWGALLSAPVNAEPTLSALISASEYLQQGDIPEDLFQPPLSAIYVAPAEDGGNDNNVGTSLDSPFEHLETAIAYANAHPETPLSIYLRGGVYSYKNPGDSELQTITRGDLYITSFNGESVTIRPSYWPGNPTNYYNERAFSFEGSFENVTFANLRFEGWSIIFNPGSSYDTPPLRNIVIKNITATAFTRRNGEEGFLRIFFETGYVSEDHYGPGKVIFDDPESAHYQIEGLILSHIRVDGVDLAINVGDENDANMRGMRVTHFEVSNPSGVAGDSASDAFAIVNSYKVLIDHCWIQNINDDGVDAKSFDVAVVNCLVARTGRNAVKFWRNGELINSILYDVTDINDAAIVVAEGPFRMINSVLFSHPVGYAGTFAYDATQTSSLKLEIVNSVFAETKGFYTATTNLHALHNRYVNILEQAALFDGSIHAADAPALNAIPGCSGNAQSTSQFVNPASGDFSLIAGSDWINAGTSAGVLLPSFDFADNPRLLGGEVDIGPFEYGLTAPTPTPMGLGDFDLWPSLGDGRIDARDLLELLTRDAASQDSLFGFSKVWTYLPQ